MNSYETVNSFRKARTTIESSPNLNELIEKLSEMSEEASRLAGIYAIGGTANNPEIYNRVVSFAKRVGNVLKDTSIVLVIKEIATATEEFNELGEVAKRASRVIFSEFENAFEKALQGYSSDDLIALSHAAKSFQSAQLMFSSLANQVEYNQIQRADIPNDYQDISRWRCFFFEKYIEQNKRIRNALLRASSHT